MIESAPSRTNPNQTDQEYSAQLAQWREKTARELGVSVEDLHIMGPEKAAGMIAAHNSFEIETPAA